MMITKIVITRMRSFWQIAYYMGNTVYDIVLSYTKPDVRSIKAAYIGVEIVEE